MEENTNMIGETVRDLFQKGIKEIPQVALKEIFDKKIWMNMCRAYAYYIGEIREIV